jgi:DNA-binding response OmpR family regulator
MRLLLIEDDQMIGESLQKALKANYAINWVCDAEEAELSLKAQEYDLLLLDLGLPKQSGIDFLKKIRTQKDFTTPVLIITARDTVQDRILGLDSGADDYLIKPFDINELEARIRVLLRRKNNRIDPVMRYGALGLNPATHELSYHDKTELLSKRSFLLVQALMERPGAILSRRQLEEYI